jgi:hypothetical protein
MELTVAGPVQASKLGASSAKPMTKTMHGIFLLAAISLAAGCASPTPVPQPVQAPQSGAPARPPRAERSPPAKDTRVIVDSALDRVLRVLGVGTSTGPDGLLKIQVDVQNITDSPQRFSYKIEWFDRNGELLPMASEDTLQWMLLAGETSPIAATAPAATAKDFEVAFLP